MDRKFLNGIFGDIEVEESLKKGIINKIMDKDGELKETHKTEIETLKNDLKVKDNLVENLNIKIKELGNVDIDAIKTEQFDLGKIEGSKEVETFKKNNALKEALNSTKTIDLDMLSKLINQESIEYEEENGNFKVKGGLDEQIETIKKEKSYLFEKEEKKEEPPQKINLGGNHNDSPQKNEPDTLLGALKEQYKK